jgi:trk system potassium uptake protein TrkA
VREVYSLGRGEGEVIEAQVMSTSPIAGKRLRDLNFPTGAIVGAVLRGDELMMPDGDTVIKVGDVLVVFAVFRAIKKVEQMFRVSMDFF